MVDVKTHAQHCAAVSVMVGQVQGKVREHARRWLRRRKRLLGGERPTSGSLGDLSMGTCRSRDRLATILELQDPSARLASCWIHQRLLHYAYYCATSTTAVHRCETECTLGVLDGGLCRLPCDTSSWQRRSRLL